jgi:hypothetical protein
VFHVIFVGCLSSPVQIQLTASDSVNIDHVHVINFYIILYIIYIIPVDVNGHSEINECELAETVTA